MELEKKVYKQILNLVKKHKDILNIDFNNLEYNAKCHLFGLELKHNYGFDINPKNINNIDWIKIGDKTISRYGIKTTRRVTNVDDFIQPEDEYLLNISFSTGPYIFGYGDIFDKDYPVDFFNKFFDELKSYNPDYIDVLNRSLYWKLDNAKDIFNNYESILEKYHKLNKEDIKQRKILKLQKELESLINK
jgi:hypothetical protein